LVGIFFALKYLLCFLVVLKMSSNTVTRFHVSTRYSEMAIHQGVVYLAGQVPSSSFATIQEQTKDVLAQVDSLLQQAGTDKTHLLRVEIFLSDLKDFDGMNEVWDAWVVVGHAPPRATVQAKLANPDWKIEILVTAALP
jgi:enamine deaminase RidA (YjgF/YER057c/UK114 family)